MDLPPSKVQYYPAPEKQKRNTLWWVIGGIFVFVSICCIASLVIGGVYYYYSEDTGEIGIAELVEDITGISPSASEQAIVATELVESVTPFAPEVSTETPIATITPTLEPTPNVNANGISFSFSPEVAQNANAETIAAAPSTGNEVFPGEVYPEHTKFSLEGYPLSDTFHAPHILVYPVQEYIDMNSHAATEINELKNFLAQKPENPDVIPFLPIWNAGQMFHSNVVYLNFQNGSGVRFLTMYGQAFYPINNNSLFYTFQGITSDGAYYITAIMPVSHPDLPATEQDIPGGDYESFINNMDTYMNETIAMLESQPSESFTPDMAFLDAMFESFVINP